MSINIWIASVCRSNEGIRYLLDAIASCLVLIQPLKLVLSISTDQDLSVIETLLKRGDKDYQICVRDKPYSQFEHIELLTREQALKEDDWVIFLDDDDMLLMYSLDHLSADINGYVGYHFIPEDRQTGTILPGSIDLTLTNLYSFMCDNHAKMIYAEDFSGSAIRFKYLCDFFAQPTTSPKPTSHLMQMIASMIEPLRDIKLMEYLETRVPNTLKLYQDPNVNPFVYHRLKNTPSIWRQQLGI